MADRYTPSHTGAPVRAGKRRKTPVWRLIIQDIFLTGLVLCVFALFHHVIPRMSIAKVEPPKGWLARKLFELQQKAEQVRQDAERRGRDRA